MNRYDWGSWTDASTARRRAGGRRRYNAARRRRAWERRAAIAAWLEDRPGAMFFNRGLPGVLAPAFGVHPSTIWRDLQYILYGGRQYDFRGPDGELLYSVTRAYPGGPVVSMTDGDGYEIRGQKRRLIRRNLPRHLGR